MQCEQARQLFDAYLDGELSPALATELGAHRVQCADCRRSLALLEVTGHLLASDKEPVELSPAFSDRLLACMDTRPAKWVRRFRRTFYVGGPLAAAAVVALAFLGVFDPQGGRVNSKIESVYDILEQPESPLPADDQVGVALDEWTEQARERMDSKRQSGESLHNMLDLTVQQWIDILNENNASPPAAGSSQPPPDDSPAPALAPEPQAKDNGGER